MSNEIVSKLMRRSHRNDTIKESFSIREADEDDEIYMDDEEKDEDDSFEEPEDSEDLDNDSFEEPESDEGEEPAGNPPTGAHRAPQSGEEPPAEKPEPEMKAEPKSVKSANPLDNTFASNFKIGDRVTLVYSNGASTELNATIEGYDKEGFYRLKWDNGSVSNGLTDTAIRSLKEPQKESACVCGCKEFVVESKAVVCDRCGRTITENLDHLTLLDKNRPAGKKMIRSIPHDMSTAVKPNIPMTEDEELPFIGYQNEF